MQHPCVMHHACNIIYHTTHIMLRHASSIRHMQQLYGTSTQHIRRTPSSTTVYRRRLINDQLQSCIITINTIATSTVIIIIIASLYSGLGHKTMHWPTSEGRTTESGVRASSCYSHWQSKLNFNNNPLYFIICIVYNITTKTVVGIMKRTYT